MVIFFFAVGFITCLGKIKSLNDIDLYGGNYEQ